MRTGMNGRNWRGGAERAAQKANAPPTRSSMRIVSSSPRIVASISFLSLEPGRGSLYRLSIELRQVSTLLRGVSQRQLNDNYIAPTPFCPPCTHPGLLRLHAAQRERCERESESGWVELKVLVFGCEITSCTSFRALRGVVWRWRGGVGWQPIPRHSPSRVMTRLNEQPSMHPATRRTSPRPGGCSSQWRNRSSSPRTGFSPEHWR